MVHLRLNSEGLNGLGHVYPCVGDLALFPRPEYLDCLGLFVAFHHLPFVLMSLLGQFELLISVDHFLHHVCVGSDPPAGKGLGKDARLDQIEEVGADSFGIGLEKVLSSDQSDSAEDLHAKLFTSDGADEINSVLLLFDVISPETEDVAASVHVDVVLDSRYVGIQSLLVVDLQLLLDLSSMMQLAGKRVDVVVLLGLLGVLL